MDRLIVAVLPAVVRAKYGEELVEMLTNSSRPVRDRSDVIIAAVGLRLGMSARPVLVTAVAATLGFLFGMVHAVRNLQHGVVEIPDHWWSTFIVAGFAASLVVAVIVCFALQRAAAWLHHR
jgi:hypothetical protein